MTPLTLMVALFAAWSPTALFLGLFGVDPNSPLAVVIVGGVIAGLFSVVNTILNLRLLKVASENRTQLEKVKMVTDTVQVRDGDSPPFIRHDDRRGS